VIFVGLSWLWVGFLGYCGCGWVYRGLWVAVVCCGFEKLWLWLGLPWVVARFAVGCGWLLWVVGCGFVVERVFVRFLIYCVDPFVLIVC
jgi:hypothetical protein